jgi:hypothetical protein
MDLIKKYEKDFTTDSNGQLSVVEILRESVADLISFIPELSNVTEQRKEAIEKQLLLFALGVYDSDEVDED